MSDKLKAFVAQHRERFDADEPPLEVWRNITSSIKGGNSYWIKSKWISNLKYLGFSASVLAVAVYFISQKLNRENVYPANESIVSMSHNSEAETRTPTTSTQDQRKIKSTNQLAEQVVSKAPDSTSQNDHENILNNVNPKSTGKIPPIFSQERSQFPDVVIDSYSSDTKTSDKFYSRYSKLVSPDCILKKGNAHSFINLPKGSYIILGFTDNYIIDAPRQTDILVEEVGIGTADVYVSSDNIEYVYLGPAGDKKVTELDLAGISFKKQVKYVKIVGKDYKVGTQGFSLLNVYGLAGANRGINEPDSNPILK